MKMTRELSLACSTSTRPGGDPIQDRALSFLIGKDEKSGAPARRAFGHSARDKLKSGHATVCGNS
jgi:hypothetical protein